MVGTAIVTALCAAGIAFYVRFIMALCQEYKPGPRGYWALLRLGIAHDEVEERRAQKLPTTRAA
jgi:hypothetical protein